MNISYISIIINDVKNLQSGEVRIGVSDTLCKYYLVPYLKLFNTLHPQIKIHVVCPTTPGIVSLLKAGRIDFGIVNLPYSDEQLEFKELLEIQDCFIAGQKYKHLSNRRQPLSEIVKYPLLMLERNSNSRLYWDRYFESNGIEAHPAFELGNMDLLIHFARYDFGLACVIRNFIEDELEGGDLYEVRPIEKIRPRGIGAAWAKDVPLSKAAQELISQLGDDKKYEI